MNLVTHRQAAKELGVSRDRFRTLVAAGIPTIRQHGKDLINVSAARDWLELFAPDGDDDQPRRATKLHPSDPRYAERSAAAEIAQIQMYLDYGHAVRRSTVLALYAAAVAEFEKHVDSLPHAVTADNWRADLDSAIATACEHLKVELPTPKPMAAPPAEEGPTPDADFLPLPASDDPRHVFAAVQAQRRASELEELRREVIGVDEAAAIVDENFAMMRAAVAKIPARVQRHVQKHGLENLGPWIEYEVERAKTIIRGDDEMPEPPQFGDSAFDWQDFDDVDGDPDLHCAQELPTSPALIIEEFEPDEPPPAPIQYVEPEPAISSPPSRVRPSPFMRR